MPKPIDLKTLDEVQLRQMLANAKRLNERELAENIVAEMTSRGWAERRDYDVFEWNQDTVREALKPFADVASAVEGNRRTAYTEAGGLKIGKLRKSVLLPFPDLRSDRARGQNAPSRLMDSSDIPPRPLRGLNRGFLSDGCRIPLADGGAVSHAANSLQQMRRNNHFLLKRRQLFVHQSVDEVEDSGLGQGVGDRGSPGSASRPIRIALDAGEIVWAHAFELACAKAEIDHRLTKPFHPWTNGQVERMNRTLKDATVRSYHYRTHAELRAHIAAFVGAYNFAKRLKALAGLTPCEAICKAWTKEPHRFRLPPDHLTSGLNI